MKLQTIFSGEHFSDKAKEAKFCPPWWAQILLFLLVFYISQVPQSLIVTVAVIFMALTETTDPAAIGEAILTMTSEPPELLMAIQLLSTVFTAAICILYCRFIERRSLTSMGLIKKGCVKKYLIGLGAGFVMFSATLLISLAAGGVRFVGFDFKNAPIFVLICVGWLFQGAEEEIVCRGYFMPSLSSKMPLWAAMLISSVFFSLMHLLNAGFNLIVLVNLTLTGIMFAVLAIRFDSLFVCCAAHSIWNLVQGNLYGLPVSGMYTGPSIFRFELTDASIIWTGGTFGLEGSLSETVIMLVVIAAAVFIPRRKKSA